MKKKVVSANNLSREKKQLELLRGTIFSALKTKFYRKKILNLGIKKSKDLRSVSQFKKIPFTEKKDLRKSLHGEMLAVSKKNIVRIHTSSGTSGEPVCIYYTKNDLLHWAGLVERSMIASGASSNDVFQNMMTYSTFTGGLGFHYGAEKLGCLVIPSGSGNTKHQLYLMKHIKTTILHATPNYVLHLVSKMKDLGFNLSDFNSLKKIYVGGEPHSKETRDLIEKKFKVDVYNSYGLTEMNGPGVAFECSYKNGMHVWEDSYFFEILDPKTMLPVKDGDVGELVLTTLKREAVPLLRYRTGDLTSVISEKCRCGRPDKRITMILGRTDDMLIINGMNIFPSQIEGLLVKICGIHINYQVKIIKRGNLDGMLIVIGTSKTEFSNSGKLLIKKLKRTFKDEYLINPRVKLCSYDNLPVFKTKAKKIIDCRSTIR